MASKSVKDRTLVERVTDGGDHEPVVRTASGPRRRLLGRLSDRLETAERIDRWSGPVNEVVQRARRAQPVRTILSGTWMGHPAHPALASVPIGCWTGAALADLCDEPGAVQALTGAGVLSALPVIATGLSDWSDTTGAEQRVGFVHLVLNLAATGCYAGSWWARRADRRAIGVGLGATGAALATSAGWLGGHLAYALGVGVDTNAFSGSPSEWTTIHPRPVKDRTNVRRGRLAGTGVAVFEQGGRTHVLADRCSHRGGPLSEGATDDGCVTCPWHASRFRLADGEVVAGPAVVAQPVYEVRHEDGEIQVRRDEPRSLRTNSV